MAPRCACSDAGDGCPDCAVADAPAVAGAGGHRADLWNWAAGVLCLLIFVGLVLGAATAPNERWVKRRDTSDVFGVLLGRAALRTSLDVYQRAFPAEGAVCYFGRVSDTVLALAHGPQPLTTLLIDSAAPAAVVEADSVHVRFANDNGCQQTRGLLGFGHDHNLIAGGACEHSDPDALYLFGRRELWFSVLLCSDGAGQVLWQDGRRQDFTWRDN